MAARFTLFIYLFFSTIFYSQSLQQFAEIGDFITQNGDTIKHCKIGYRTMGKMNADYSNIVIYCSWLGGSSEAIITALIEKRNFIDTTKFYIIAFDALGNGVSSSPSNYKFGEFPLITVRDMVNAQHLVMNKYLGVKKVYGAVGGSMGSIQVLEWAVSYPGFIEKIISYVGSPKITSFDLLWINTQLKFIDYGRKYGWNDLEIKTISDMINAIIGRTPEYVNKHIKPDKFDEYLSSFENEPSKTFTIDNYVCQLKAISTHNIYRQFGDSMEQAAKNITSKMFFIVAVNDLMVNPSETLKLAELTNSKLLLLNNECGHLAVSCEFDRIKSEIDLFLSK